MPDAGIAVRAPGLAPARGWPVATMLTVALLLALPALAQFAGMTSVIPIATRIVILGLAAGSLNVIMGQGGLVSFGHAAYLGLGAYTVGILNTHFVSGEPLFGALPGTNLLAVTLPAAVLVAGGAAALLGALCLRTSGVQFIMITLAFAQMLFFLFVSLKAYGGDDGLLLRRPNVFAGLNLRDPATMFYLSAACLVAYLLLWGRIARSGFGRVLAGSRQSERRMAAIGIRTYPYKLAAFAFAGMGAGLAGALLANNARFVSPDSLHWTQSGDLLIMVVIGSAGGLFGPLWGAAVLIGLESVLAQWTEYWQIVLGPLLVLVALRRPGLFHRAGLMLRRA